MNEPNDRTLTKEEARARDAVRTLPAPAADEAFRANLKAAFADGSIAARPRRIVPLPWYRRIGAGWIVAPAAAAAAVLIAIVLNAPPAWNVTASRGDGAVVVDGRSIPIDHVADLDRALRPGAHVVVPEGGELQLVSADRLMLLATSGTEFVVPRAPGRWFQRTVNASVRHGTLRVATEPGFAGAKLMVTTPEAAVEVLGSTLAIICESTGTCVCVLDGDVHVGPLGGGMERVEGGMRRYVYNDGRPPEMHEMRPDERVKLTQLREQASHRI